jgi:hypothetical protein
MIDLLDVVEDFTRLLPPNDDDVELDVHASTTNVVEYSARSAEPKIR